MRELALKGERGKKIEGRWRKRLEGTWGGSGRERVWEKCDDNKRPTARTR